MISIKTKEAFNNFTNTIFQSFKDGKSLNQARNDLAKKLGFNSINALGSSLDAASAKIPTVDELYNSLVESFPNETFKQYQINEVYLNLNQHIELAKTDNQIDVFEQIGSCFDDSMGNSELILQSVIELDGNKVNLRQFLMINSHAQGGYFSSAEFQDSTYKALDQLSLSVDVAEIPNKGLMITKAAVKVAKEHKEKIESVLGRKFEFEYDPYRVTYIFNGTIEE